ncbi:MAG: DUF885 family protein [Mycoplasmatales bacterium]|nr:DUF885 family protein [Mycoplasmatales bacterium]
MRKKLSIGVLAAATGMVIIPITMLASCGKSNNNVDQNPQIKKDISQMIKDFDSEKSKIAPAAFGSYTPLTKANQPKFKANIEKFEKKVAQFEEKIGRANLYENDYGVWLESFKYQLSLEKEGYEVNSRVLGANPANGYFKPINTFWNPINDLAEYVSSDLDTSNKEDVNKRIEDLKNTLKVIEGLEENFKEGLKSGTTFSGVYTRQILNDLMDVWGDGTIDKTKNNNFTTVYLKTIKTSKLDASIKSSYKIENDKLIDKVNEFMKFMTTDYWKGIKFGISKTSDHTKAFTTDKGRTSASVAETTTDPGLTKEDLETKDVGIGFSGKNGQDIYKHILHTQTTTDKLPSDLISDGNKGVKSNVKNMEAAAAAIYKEEMPKGGDWIVKGAMIDPDGPGAMGAKSTDLTIKDSQGIHIDAFYAWLKSGRFAVGREKGASSDTSKVDSKYAKILDDAGYKSWKTTDKAKPIDGNGSKVNGNIRGDQAYVGMANYMKSVDRFKADASATIKKHFAPVKHDYTFTVPSYGTRSREGVGAYNPGSFNMILGVDPYYALTKWSMQTLISHETISGHHFQNAYYEEHKDALAPRFSYTAYSEGWGLFSEWLSVRMNIYGIASKDINGVPDNGVPNFAKGSEGVKFDSSNLADKFQGSNIYKNQTEYNALQYCGYLNESQLRAMRLVLDTGVHSGAKGDFAIGTGMSIQDERDYMAKNSALGVGDMQSESRRYLQYVGQATSYFTGKTVISDLYTKFYAHELKSDDKLTLKEEQKFFGTVLRNNDIPLNVLKDYVTKQNDFKL